MGWLSFSGGRLADVVTGGLIVLAVGSLAVGFCRQPVRRARLVMLTLLGATIAPGLGALSIVPHWSAGLFSAQESSGSHRVGGATAFVAEEVHFTSESAVRFDARPAGGSVASPPSAPAEGRSVSWAWTVLLGAYGVVAVGLAAWWLAGQVLLWRVSRRARPVSAEVRDQFQSLAGPGGGRVVLLESDRVASPFTYTWIRPVIVLPSTFCDAENDPEVLRYALAHEWSHVERRDAWSWNLVCLAGIVLWLHPLYWWLRRQLRVCQDYLADARAAAVGSAEDYASLLVRLARSRGTGPAIPALGIGDRRSNLSRRVMMLVQVREPLELRCRLGWSLSAALAAAAVIVAASGLRLAAAPPDEKPIPAGAATPGDSKPTEATVRDARPVRDQEAGPSITGRIVTPEGKPAAGVELLAYFNRANPPSWERAAYPYAQAKTDAAGAFRLSAAASDAGVLWVFPKAYAPSMHPLDGRRDVGTIVLKSGTTVTGRLLDLQGKPVAGVFVEAERLPYRGSGRELEPEFGLLRRLGTGDAAARRTAETDAEGRFTLDPLAVGSYRVAPSNFANVRLIAVEGPGQAMSYRIEPSYLANVGTQSGNWGWRELPGAFASRLLTIQEGAAPEPLEFHAVPHVVLEGRYLDSRGRPWSGWVGSVSGSLDGLSWSARTKPDSQGKFSLMVPLGLKDGWFRPSHHPSRIHVLRCRLGNDGPLVDDPMVRLGTIDHDVKGLEIVRYDAPILIIKATTEDGRVIPGCKPTIGYVKPGQDVKNQTSNMIAVGMKEGPAGVFFDPNEETHLGLVATRRSQDLRLEPPYCQWRALQLIPDRPVIVAVAADGYVPASRTLSLAEGAIEEVNFVLTPQ